MLQQVQTAVKARCAFTCHRPTIRKCIRVQAAAEFKGCSTPLAAPIKVVGCGSCGVDYLASVLAYPKPDEKLRTETFEVQGGGNCANALTACARLGLSPVIMTKIGGDGMGDGIISELQADGVDTQFILREPGSSSPFTYIIVDKQGGTRTCIHTPGAALLPSDVDTVYLSAVLDGASLVYFDGRLTEAALKLAERAKQLSIPILVEAERLRPNLDRLLQYGDYVVTSSHFPQDWTGEKHVSDAILATAQRLPRAKVVITTMGTGGSILLERVPAGEKEGSPEKPLDEIMLQLRESLERSGNPASSSGAPDCVSSAGVNIQCGSVVHSDGMARLGYSEAHNQQEAENQARDAACRAATLNAEAGNIQGYAMCPAMCRSRDHAVTAKVTLASIASLPKGAVVDTTGAGDAFIGAVIYGIVTGMPYGKVLQLGSMVAGAKCTALGARPGLPKRSQLTASLLGC